MIYKYFMIFSVHLIKHWLFNLLYHKKKRSFNLLGWHENQFLKIIRTRNLLPFFKTIFFLIVVWFFVQYNYISIILYKYMLGDWKNWSPMNLIIIFSILMSSRFFWYIGNIIASSRDWSLDLSILTHVPLAFGYLYLFMCKGIIRCFPSCTLRDICLSLLFLLCSLIQEGQLWIHICFPYQFFLTRSLSSFFPFLQKQDKWQLSWVDYMHQHQKNFHRKGIQSV